MAVLTDKNLANYKKYLSDMKTQVSAWTTYLSNAETLIQKNIRSNF